MLKILTRRLENTAESHDHGNDQFGSRNGRDTRDAIAALRVLYGRNLEYDNKVYVCYVDYEIAFDHVGSN